MIKGLGHYQINLPVPSDIPFKEHDTPILKSYCHPVKVLMHS